MGFESFPFVFSRRLDDERPDLQVEGAEPGAADQEPLAARRLQAGQLQQPQLRRRHGHRWVRLITISERRTDCRKSTPPLAILVVVKEWPQPNWGLKLRCRSSAA